MLFLKDSTNPRISDGNISDKDDTLQECPDNRDQSIETMIMIQTILITMTQIL